MFRFLKALATWGYGCPPHPAIVLRDGRAYCTECGQPVG